MPFSIIASAMAASLIGFGSTLAVIAATTAHLGATPAQASSWLACLCLGVAATSAGLSVWLRMPIVTAWSLGGLVLLLAAPASTTMASATGAFVFAGALMVLAGSVPALGHWIARLPSSIAAGMLAGLLLRFPLALFAAAERDPALVLPLVGLYLVARLFHPASAPLVVIALAAPLALLEGHQLTPPGMALSTLAWTTPRFETSALIGLGIPLFLVTMATQQISGAAVLRVAGYTPPMRPIMLTTGLATVLLAPAGAYSINLSSLTAAICTGPEAHPDPARRWQTGPVYAVMFLLFAATASSIAGALASLPPVLVAAVVGVALIVPLANALGAMVAHEAERFAAVFAFAVTASGMTLFGVGSAFWGLIAGLLVLALERRR